MLLRLIIVLATGLGIDVSSHETARDTLLTQNEGSAVSAVNETTGPKSQPVVEKQSRSDVLAILKARDEREIASADQEIETDCRSTCRVSPDDTSSSRGRLARERKKDRSSLASERTECAAKESKRRRLRPAAGGIIRHRPEYRNDVWSVDFIFDWTSNGRPLKIPGVIDEYTREWKSVGVSPATIGWNCRAVC